jgi:ankyrin repeat protein
VRLGSELNAVDENENTALHTAAGQGNLGEHLPSRSPVLPVAHCALMFVRRGHAPVG